MIYKLIRDFTNLRIAYFNQAKTELVDLNENVQWLDVDNLPNNASDIYYNFKISDYENDDEIEANMRVFVNVAIEFSLPLFNLGVEKYQSVIDEYTYNLTRLFNWDSVPNSQLPYKNELISQGITITELHKIRFTDTNKITNGYLNPTLNIEFVVFDESEQLFPIVETTNNVQV